MSARFVNTHQASGLFQTEHPVRKPRVVCVTGGKGGVGKSSVSVNLAVALSNLNQKVLLLDADLGLSNIDVLLGLHTSCDLLQVLQGERTIKDILVSGPGGIQIIPSTSGREIMTQLSKPEYAGIITAFQELSGMSDFLLVDTAAGISEGVTSFINASDEVICVVCDEPTSITDTYALIKLMSLDYGVNKFYILVNMVQSYAQGKKLYENIFTVADKFLDVNLELLGVIPVDSLVKKSICHQVAVVDKYPQSQAAVELKKVAHTLLNKEFKNYVGGKTTFFKESIYEEY